MNIVGYLPSHIHGVSHLLFPLNRSHILFFNQFIPRVRHCVLCVVSLECLNSRVSGSSTTCVDLLHDTFLSEKVVGLRLFLGEFPSRLINRFYL